MPKIIACGSRRDAYDSFCTTIDTGENALLLVDSESPVATNCQPGNPENWQPWRHLKNRTGDQWDKPATAEDKDCHLMVQCMEAWFLADRENLEKFFGQGFKANSLPAVENQIESVVKNDVYRSLSDATKNCKTKEKYGKGEHSFKLLALISPGQVAKASPWAKRFIDIAKEKADAGRSPKEKRGA